jgi:hypothetical protein
MCPDELTDSGFVVATRYEIQFQNAQVILLSVTERCHGRENKQNVTC